MAKELFRFNTRRLGENVRRALQAQPVKTRRAMEVGGYLNGETKDLTPVDEGFLTADVSNMTVQYNSSFAAVIYIPSNAASAKYAIPMHENRYFLGRNSREKQRKVGKPVGRKFITRAMYGHLERSGSAFFRLFCKIPPPGLDRLAAAVYISNKSKSNHTTPLPLALGTGAERPPVFLGKK